MAAQLDGLPAPALVVLDGRTERTTLTPTRSTWSSWPTDALDSVRHQVWQSARKLCDKSVVTKCSPADRSTWAEYLLRTFERAYIRARNFNSRPQLRCPPDRFSMRFDDILVKRMGGVAAVRPPLPLTAPHAIRDHLPHQLDSAAHGCVAALATVATTATPATGSAEHRQNGTSGQQLNALPVNLSKAQCVKHKSPKRLSRGPPGQQHLIGGITDSALHILPALRGRSNQ
jgi:hypothetical protein